MRRLSALLLLLCSTLTAAQSYPAMIKSVPSLVGYWRMNESNGNLADSSGNGSTATASAGMTYSAAPVVLDTTDTAITFASSNGASVSNYTPYDFEYTHPFTLELAFRPGAGVATGNYTLVANMQAASPITGYDLHLYNGKLQFYFFSNVTNDYIQVDVSLAAYSFLALNSGISYLIDLTYDGSGKASGVQFYINGGPVTQDIITDTLGSNSTVNTSNFVIGNRNGGCCAASGTIGQVAVYNTSLSAQVIAAHAVAANLAPIAENTASVPSVIWDNDAAVDIENFWALADFLQWAKLGYAKPLAAIVTDSTPYSAVCVDAMARYYGFNLTIGAYQGNLAQNSDEVNCSSYATTYLPGKTTASYSTDAQVYRSVLAAAANNSVTIVVAGPAQGLYDLMNDGFSPSGATLIANKVSKVIWAAGGYATGTEFNFSGGGSGPEGTEYPLVANYVLANWPNTVPIEFISNITQTPESGGNTIISSNAVYGASSLGNPLYLLRNGNGCGATLAGYCGNGRESWDVMPEIRALLDPSNTYFTVNSSNGNNAVNSSTGTNTWTATPNNNMSWLQNAATDQQFMSLVNTYLYQDGHQWSATWQ